jgi:hypothetical protein
MRAGGVGGQYILYNRVCPNYFFFLVLYYLLKLTYPYSSFFFFFFLTLTDASVPRLAGFSLILL